MAPLQTMTLEQAGDLIASRLRGNVKYAADPPSTSWADSISNTVKPWLSSLNTATAPAREAIAQYGRDFSPMQNTGHAAVLGGGLGLGLGAMRALSSSDKEKRKRWIRHALFGGAMGGLGGVAFGEGKKGLSGLLRGSDRVEKEFNRDKDPKAMDMLGHAADTVSRAFGGKVVSPEDDPSNKPDVTGMYGSANPDTTGTAGAAYGLNGENNIIANTARAFAKNNPAYVTGTVGAIGGGWLDRALSNRAVNNYKIPIARDAINSANGLTTKQFDDINTALKASRHPEITHTQVNELRSPSSKSPVALAGRALETAATAGHNATTHGFNFYDKYIRPHYAHPSPPGLYGMQHETRPYPEARGMGNHQVDQVFSTVAPNDSRKAAPKRRAGAVGAVLGGGAGVLLDAVSNTKPVSAADILRAKQRAAITPPMP